MILKSPGPALLVALGCVPMPALVLAADASLSSRNQSTLARSFALPSLGQTAPETSSGAWRLSVDLTSEYVAKEEGGELLVFDGETQRYALRHADGWGGDRGDWSIEVPLLHTGGGTSMLQSPRSPPHPSAWRNA